MKIGKLVENKLVENLFKEALTIGEAVSRLGSMGIKSSPYSDPSLDGLKSGNKITHPKTKYEIILGINDQGYPVIILLGNKYSIELVFKGMMFVVDVILMLLEKFPNSIDSVKRNISGNDLKDGKGGYFNLKFINISEY